MKTTLTGNRSRFGGSPLVLGATIEPFKEIFMFGTSVNPS